MAAQDVRFHDPDLSWSVFRRRAADEVLHLIGGAFVMAASRGKMPVWSDSSPEKRRYRNAVYRLKKDGLVAAREGRGGRPCLVLTEEGEKRLRHATRPERFWRRRWRGTWFVLVYDVPEEERKYRDALRRFLKRMRMGQLQRSVWISPDDVRGEFADLQDAAAVDDYAFLLESQTLLGMEPWSMAWKAWKLEQLEREQDEFCNYCKKCIDQAVRGQMKGTALVQLARQELNAYLDVMGRDPLLPRAVLPRDYAGFRVYELHKEFTRECGVRL